MMGWYGGGMGFAGWFFMGFFWLVLLGVIIWAIVRLLPAARSGSGGSRASETPEEILDRRFARGEIDHEAYQSQREALAQSRRERQSRP
jgi:putative membrane protein